MKTIYLIMIFAILLTAIGTAKASDALEYDFNQANEAYQKGDYEEAIDNYLKLVAVGIDNSTLQYNLGNAYFKTDQLGMAIACYHRALKLDPRNDDILANLEFARQNMIDKVDPTATSPIWNWYRSIVLYYTANEWTVLTSIFLLLSALILIYMIWTRERGMIVKGILSLLLVLFMISGICGGVNINLNYLKSRGAIVVPEVSIKVGPGGSFDEQFIAHEGLTFDILKQESGWYLGVFDNRLKGWIKVADATSI
ncbi:MAG: tetratricopeptide repeat protein [Candidatus Zixiibacteriota bacterium]